VSTLHLLLDCKCVGSFSTAALKFGIAHNTCILNKKVKNTMNHRALTFMTICPTWKDSQTGPTFMPNAPDSDQLLEWLILSNNAFINFQNRYFKC